MNIEYVKKIIFLIEVIQLPLVGFIAILFFKAHNEILRPEKYSSGIGYGFSANFLYLLCSVLLDLNEDTIVFIRSQEGISWIENIRDGFGLLVSFCFISSFTVWLKERTKNNRIVHLCDVYKIFVSIPLLVFLFLLKSNYIITPHYVPVITDLVYSFISLTGIIIIFYKSKRSMKSSQYMIIGFIFWDLLQLLTIGTKYSNTEEMYVSFMLIGFISSLIAKALILYGSARWYVDYAINAAQDARSYDNLLKHILHDIHVPLDDLNQALGEFKIGIKLSNKDKLVQSGKENIKVLESNYARIRAIINLSRVEYNLQKEHDDDTNLETIQSVNVNDLIELSVRRIKNKLKREKKIKGVKFDPVYEKDTVVDCRKSDIQIIIDHILLNAYEAYPENKQRKIICISSSIIEKDELVLVTIQDFGTGIEEKNIDKIWEEGFSTKDKPTSIKGQGLSTVKRIVEKSDYLDIKCESPTFYDGKPVTGTKFYIYFKIN